METQFEWLDLDTWKRKNQFLFFKDFEQPFFEICLNVEAKKLYDFCKQEKHSFFLAYMFLSIKASNLQPEFRLRIEGDKVKSYNRIHGGSTILNPDETFSFCYFDFDDSFDEFKRKAAVVLEENRKNFGKLNPQVQREDLIHYSTIPWLKFMSIGHASRIPTKDSVPKIVFGKYHEANGKGFLPISVKVHHALMDALHVSKYIQLFESYCINPEKLLS